MEIAYLMAGKRFKTDDVLGLNRELAQYNLVTNLTLGGRGDLTARRVTDPAGTNRYSIEQAYGDSADIDGYDVCIGKVICNNGYSSESEVSEPELSEIERVLNEIREDMPDARLLVGSYWS